MSKERNKTHKKNRIKKQNEFWNCKASFVSGVSVIAVSINDIIGLCMKIPFYVNLIEFICVLLLFYLALGTNKMDRMLRTKGVENFGAFLTVFSVVEFLLGRVLISSAEGVEIAYKWSNEKMQAVVILSMIAFVGIGGSIYLLLYRYPKS